MMSSVDLSVMGLTPAQLSELEFKKITEAISKIAEEIKHTKENKAVRFDDYGPIGQNFDIYV